MLRTEVFGTSIWISTSLVKNPATREALANFATGASLPPNETDLANSASFLRMTRSGLGKMILHSQTPKARTAAKSRVRPIQRFIGVLCPQSAGEAPRLLCGRPGAFADYLP